MGSRREVLLPIPRAAARALAVGWEGFFINHRRVHSDHAASVHRHDGVIVLVDSGAEKAPAKAALRLRVQAGQLSRQKLILLFIGAAVPTTRCRSVPGPVAAQAFHIGNHLIPPSDWLDPGPGPYDTLSLQVPKICQPALVKTMFPAQKQKTIKVQSSQKYL